MGGSIRVILREEDGAVHKMHRWTNSIPDFVNNMKFINKEKAHINEYMKAHLDMKADYEKNNESGNFEHNMTDCYWPQDEMTYPIGYGIVVFDYKNNVVLSCQGYCTMGGLYSSHASMYAKNHFYDQEEKEITVPLFSGKRIINMQYVNDGGLHKIDIKDSSDREEILQLVENYRFINKFTIDMNPFTVIKFKEEKEGFLQLKEKLKELGFEITEEDERQWDEYISYHYDEDDIDLNNIEVFN